jgi:acetyl esterase
MPVNPQIQGLLDLIASKNLPPHYLLAPPEARIAMEKSRAILRGPEVSLARTEPLNIPSLAGPIPARLYAATTGKALPVLVYFHGGGWVIGSLDTHDDLCRRLAVESGCMVISVGYRLAPEHKFPAAVDDAFAATRWISKHAFRLGGDSKRLAVGGDSAGGNLAAAVALLAREAGGLPISYQLLIYPVATQDFTLPSMTAHGEGYLLTKTGMQWFWNHYVRTPADAKDLRASPLLAPSHKDLPPAFVALAEYDILRDEGVAYARKLEQAGVPVRLEEYAGMIHGFASMSVVDRTLEILQEWGRGLRDGLG